MSLGPKIRSDLNSDTVQLHKKTHDRGSRMHMAAVDETLGTGVVRQCVKCPYGIPEDEWIMSHFMGIFDEYQHVITISMDICPRCKCLTAGSKFSYKWADEENPRPRYLSATDYMLELQYFINKQWQDGKLVRRKDNTVMPGCRDRLRVILKRMFRVYAHLYLDHYQFLHNNRLVAHMNVYFKHFLFYVSEFDLVSSRDMAPMKDLIQQFEEKDEEERDAGLLDDYNLYGRPQRYR